MYLGDKKCKCGNCNKIFLFKERKTINRKLFGITINESICPFCGSSGYTQESFENWLIHKYENLNW